MKLMHGLEVFDTLEEMADPAHTALVVIDIQNDFCHRDGHFARFGKAIGPMEAMVPAWVEFVREAQALGVFTVFLRQITLPGGRSESPAWMRLKCRDGKSPEYTMPGSWGAEFIEGLAPGPRDAVVEKLRPDGFVRTMLDSVLRNQGVKTLVMIGTTTEGCVESTVRGGSYHDYYVVPVEDLISGPIARLHGNSLEFMRARYPVAHSAQVLEVWRQAGSGNAPLSAYQKASQS